MVVSKILRNFAAHYCAIIRFMQKNMRKSLMIWLAAVCASGMMMAQRSETFVAPDAALKEGIRLYQIGQYAASQRSLANAENSSEMAFYNAANAFELRQNQALKQLKAFLKNNPQSPYESEVHFMMGVLNAEKRKFKQALKELDQVQSSELFRQHEDACIFYKGYSHLHMNEPRAAAGFFQRLHSKEESPFYLQSRYYYAYSQYALGQYKRALPDFLFCEQTNEYKHVAPYYIVQIYYYQGKYDEVINRAKELLAQDPENVNNWELYRILGEMAYQQGEYEQSIDYLQRYAQAAEKQKAGLVREDLYLLGVSCYQANRNDEAITYLKKVQSQNDSLTQSAQYYLGCSYTRAATAAASTAAGASLATIDQAKACFATAMRMDFSPVIKEEAMYNYALCTYQSSSALGESVNAFMSFLGAYPESRHAEEVYSLLSDVFMLSKNYLSALEALQKIKHPNEKMLQTQQYLRYQLGADCFLQSRHTEAIKWFDEVIAQAAGVDTYKTEALFLRAESQYRLQRYTEAEQSIQLFENQSNAVSSKNYALAKYLEGYICFQQKHYTDAAGAFASFTKIADQSKATYADALNRLGDCYFSQRAFVDAESYYAQVVALGTAGADYAMFQRGYALGLLKRYGDKVTVLERLVTTYPKSDYADDGLYEIARAQLQRDDNTGAIIAYDRLLATYPNSNLARKAALEKAMLYYNEKKYAEAIEAYKLVVKNYPSTNEAYSALEGIEMCYVETNQVNEYLAYTKSLGKNNMQIVTTKEDSLTYTAAELQYMQGNYSEAAQGLSTYLERYCEGGRYCSSAQYYCADAYYQMGDKKNALIQFKRLTEIEANSYMEEALMRTAELYYDEADYQNALTYFERLQTAASTQKNTDIARLGVLRCAYFLGNSDRTISIASEMLEESTTDEATQEEALYNRAKAYYQNGQYDKAIADFRILAKEVRTVQGAESEYMICEALFRQGKYTETEAEIVQFANMNTTQQYWLAKAFILLADVYTRQGDDFQAEQYLISLQSNYTIQDDIQTMISERLQLIKERANASNDATDQENEEED